MSPPPHDRQLGSDETGPHSKSPPRRAATHSLVQRALHLIEALVLLALAGTLLGFLGRFHFLPDLATHFRFQSMTVMLLGGGLLSLCGRRGLGWSGLAAGIVLLGTYWPYVVPRSSNPSSPTYRFVVMNVLTHNANRQGLTAYLRQLEPDFLLLMEVDDSWREAIQDVLQDDLPHALGQPRGDNFGIWFMSRHGWDDAQLPQFEAGQPPSIDVLFTIDGQPLRIVGTHPLPPMSPSAWQSRNTQLANVAESVRDHPCRSKTILAGDLNCSPWSTFFQRLLARSQLSDSAVGQGLRPTWYVLPSWFGGLPIDHVLVGDDVEVVERSVGPDLGSDHRAVIVDFAWRTVPTTGRRQRDDGR